MFLYPKGNGSMKNLLYYWLIFVLVGVVFLGMPTQDARANLRESNQGMSQSVRSQQAVQTPIPWVSPTMAVIETPESRVLPPVGSNAGLVIGASVLVLIIIIGGVLNYRRRQNH
jgi:hypothetical protein